MRYKAANLALCETREYLKHIKKKPKAGIMTAQTHFSILFFL